MPRRYDLELFLKQADLFRNMTSKDRQRLAAVSQERRFSKGETVFHEGRLSDSIWLVLEGRVHLLHYLAAGRVQTTCVMAPRETFCCLPALDRGVYPATAVAATSSRLLQIPTGVFHGMMEKSPTLLKETLCLFCNRLRQVEAKGCLAQDPVEQRIAQVLLTLQKKFGNTIPLMRQEIAEVAGTTVETAIRMLSRFEKAGWIRSARGKLEILQPGRLQRVLP